ncbi:MAG: hypothetical protein K2X03_04105 [Bryobacteraceae bacterium]|nr:hypothetical protein [Bryobacteraceae bacterium]
MSLLLTVAGLYAVIGLFFGLAFVSTGIRHVDPAANGSGFAFRLIILPGVAALWPVLLSRWISTRRA